jgi:phosphoglycolate phosphatase
VLFDLDGTLIDSAADIAAAINEVLAMDRLGPLPVPEVRSMVGNGIRKLVERAYTACGTPLDEARLDARHATMMEVYGHHLTNLTTLMPGAAQAVESCAAAGMRLAVITNKPEGFSREILAHFNLLPPIDLVVGGDSGPARKPAPDMLMHACAAFGISPSDAVMIGDGPADIEAARAVPMRSLAVRGGYTPVPAEQLGADGWIEDLTRLGEAMALLAKGAERP